MQRLKKLTFVVSFLLLVFQIFSVFQKVESHSFYPDELAWVYDSQIYLLRKDGDQRILKYSFEYLDSRWGSLEYRIIDQPQFGKYLYGFFLSIFHPDLYSSAIPALFDEAHELYSRYAYYWDAFVGRGVVEVSDEVGGDEWVTAILFARYISFAFFVLIIILNSFFIWFMTKSKTISVLSSLLIASNKLFVEYASVAMMDMPSLFFMYLSVVLYVVSSSKNFKGKFKYLLIFSGFAAAIAASTKLNGLFLLLVPLFFISRSEIKKWFFNSLIYLVSFAILFLFFEIAVIYDPSSFFVLLTARLQQQSAFLSSYNNLSLIEYLRFYIETLVSSFGGMLTMLIFGILGYFSYHRIKRKGRKLNRKLKRLLFLASYFLLANYYYARVGFGRYLLLTVLITVIIASYQLHILEKEKL